MSVPFKLKTGWVTKTCLFNLYAKGQPTEFGKIINRLQQKNQNLFEIIQNRKDGRPNYVYSRFFVKKLIKEIGILHKKNEAAALKKLKEKEERENWLSCKELARKFRTRSRVIRHTIDKYEIGKETTLVVKKGEEYLIHKSLELDVSHYILPDADDIPSARSVTGGHKPSLDDYDTYF